MIFKFNIIPTFFYSFFFNIFSIFKYFLFKPNTLLIKNISINDSDNNFIDINKRNFLKLFDTNIDRPLKNSNIDSFFYSKNIYQESFNNNYTVIENKWKSKILFVNTPRGNIIMYYNPYKLGFSYFSDQFVPYNILNSVAMKYVLFFNCCDFFFDEFIRPDTDKNPLLSLLDEDKKIINNDEKNTIEKIKPLKSNTFIKLKSYNNKFSNNTDCNDKNIKQKERNRFINMGKICNFYFLQKPVKYNVLFPNFENNDLTNIHKEVFNYKDYKVLFANK